MSSIRLYFTGVVSKAQQKKIRELGTKKGRKEQGLFLVEGGKGITELLLAIGKGLSSFPISGLYTTEDLYASWDGRVRQIAERNSLTIVSPAELALLSTLDKNVDGVALVGTPLFAPRVPKGRELILACDGIRDPGNLGTLIRTAAWFRARQVVCSPDCVEWTGPKCIAATMGAFTSIEVATAPLPDYLKLATAAGASTYGAMLEGATLERGTPNPEGARVLVIGSESHGISGEVTQELTARVRIPGGGTESLNAGVAGGILLWHLSWVT
jgi:RNA methyltransferase, TrmH family